MMDKSTTMSLNNNKNTQPAAIVTLPLITHPHWAKPHTHTCKSTLEQIHAPITSLDVAQLTTPAISTIPQLTILTPRS